MLSLPHLEVFECPISSFPHSKLPEMKHISKLNILFDNADPLFTEFLEAVRKMHCLNNLMIDYWSYVSETDLLYLVCGVIEATTSLGKDVILSHFCIENKYAFHKQLKIIKAGNHDVDKKIFKLSLCDDFYDVERLCEGVATFVRNKLHSYEVVVIRK